MTTTGAGLPPSTSVVSCTATCGLVWSSPKMKWSCLPRMPPVLLITDASASSVSFWPMPTKAAPPVSGTMTWMS